MEEETVTADELQKAQAGEIEKLRAELDALRRDSEKAQLELKASRDLNAELMSAVQTRKEEERDPFDGMTDLEIIKEFALHKIQELAKKKWGVER